MGGLPPRPRSPSLTRALACLHRAGRRYRRRRISTLDLAAQSAGVLPGRGGDRVQRAHHCERGARRVWRALPALLLVVSRLQEPDLRLRPRRGVPGNRCGSRGCAWIRRDLHSRRRPPSRLARVSALVEGVSRGRDPRPRGHVAMPLRARTSRLRGCHGAAVPVPRSARCGTCEPARPLGRRICDTGVARARRPHLCVRRRTATRTAPRRRPGRGRASALEVGRHGMARIRADPGTPSPIHPRPSWGRSRAATRRRPSSPTTCPSGRSPGAAP